MKNFKIKVFLFSLLSVFVPISFARAAGDESKIAQFFSWVLLGVNKAFGGILTTVMSIVNKVFAIQDFSIGGVDVGWVAVRDVCNMFFILLLLLIAFATILRVENYSIKRLLPKVVIMAVLINFSKLFCFLLIDFSQVLMLTFVNAFIGSEGNFVEMLHLDKLQSLKSDNDALTGSDKVDDWSIFSALLLATIFITITLFVMVTFAAVLITRIVMFWILIVLSPMAFFSYIIPSGSSFFSKWWGEFTKYLIIGPALAFFTWLSLLIMQNASVTLLETDVNTASDVSATISAMGTWKEVFNFILGISMLVAGLKMSQGMGVAGGGIGMNMTSALKNKSLSAGKKVALAPVKGAGALAKAGVGATVDSIHAGTGFDMNLKRAWEGTKQARAKKAADRYARGQERAGEIMASGDYGTVRGILAMTGAPKDAWNQITSKKGIYQRIKGGRRMAEDRERLTGKLNEEKTKVKNESEFLKLSEGDRVKKIESWNEKSDNIQKQIDAGATGSVREKLIETKTEIDRMREFGNVNVGASEDKVKIINNTNRERLDEIQKELEANIPLRSREAREAGNKQVSEKMGEIKDIVSGDELMRVLSDAFRIQDKAMIKAVSKRMTQDGDLNDILGKYADNGDTGVDGLHSFVRKLKDEHGFSEQESMELGNDLSHITKGIGQWSMAGAYGMENGQWKEVDAVGRADYVRKESSKMHTQKMVRDNGRLAYGKYVNGEYEMDAAGVQILVNLDNEDGHTKIKKDMQISAAVTMANTTGPKSLESLKDKGVISPELYGAILERAESKAGEKSTKEIHNEIVNALNS